MAEEMDITTAIATISTATQMITRVNDIDEAVQLVRQFGAIEEVLKKCKAAYIHQYEATRGKILSERQLGFLLIREIKVGRPSKSSESSRVSDYGISFDDSSRCQRIAGIAHPELESYFETMRAEGKELTTAGVMRLWKALNSEESQQEQKVFLPSQQQQEITAWLARRRDSWPEQFQPTFCNFVRRILEHLEGVSEDDRGEGADTTDAEVGAA